MYHFFRIQEIGNGRVCLIFARKRSERLKLGRGGLKIVGSYELLVLNFEL